MRLGILHTTIRLEEKLIARAATQQGIEIQFVDVREEIFNPATYKANFDVAVERCVSTIKGEYAVSFLESLGIPVFNSSKVARICEDKFLTSLALKNHAVPTPEFALVFAVDQAIRAVEEVGGFPIVIKPNIGSWGRLLAKINDQDSLEAIIEHKDVLGSSFQKPIYIQKFVEKNGRDIRAFSINGQAICAVYRASSHWITNTARGGIATNCKITSGIRDIVRFSSDAVGGGILAMDIFETLDGLSINEINHTMEFKNSEEPTGVSISGAIVEYCISSYRHPGKSKKIGDASRIPNRFWTSQNDELII